MSRNLFNPTYLKELCQQYHLSPSKSYGQNFLISEWPVEKMIEAAELKKSDTVIEIGPGFGVLTFALAEKAEKVIAFEIERKLQPYWEEQKEIRKLGNLEIVWGNALKQVSSFKFQVTSYKVVANLPYQITSHVLRTLLELPDKPESITVMVQKEVAERICAVPRGERQRALRGKVPSVSLLAVSVQYYGQPGIIAKVSKNNFWPKPKVDSAILNIKTKKQESKKAVSDSEFFKVVKAGFSNKRKQLWKNLATQLKVESYKVKSVIGEVVGNEKVRAEELSVGEWKNIVELLYY